MNRPRQKSAAAQTLRLLESVLPLWACLALFDRGRRAPRFFMISIVALYSRIRRVNSSRRSCSRRSRSAPTGAGEAGGAAPLRAARIASLGCFACARALASASVTGPTSAAVFLVSFFRRFLIPAFARATRFVFLRLPEAAMVFPLFV